MTYTYKTIPAPMALTVKGKEDPESAIRSYAAVINSECIDGWEFYSMESMTTHKPQGCFGGATQTVIYNMLVFRKPI